jgi:hypothetical protein
MRSIFCVMRETGNSPFGGCYLDERRKPAAAWEKMSERELTGIAVA